MLPVLYLSSWLLTSFGSDFPLFFSSRVLDVVLTGTYPHAVLKVIAASISASISHKLAMWLANLKCMLCHRLAAYIAAALGGPALVLTFDVEAWLIKHIVLDAMLPAHTCHDAISLSDCALLPRPLAGLSVAGNHLPQTAALRD